MGKRTWVTIALLALSGFGIAAKEEKQRLEIKAISYRAIPHESTTYYQTSGHSSTACYGSGTDYGYSTAINLNCQTTTTPPETVPMTVRSIDVYNQVETGGRVYTIGCTANWIGSRCSWLGPGESFEAEMSGTTMWVIGGKGGNLGKQVRVKFRVLDVRSADPDPSATTEAPPAVEAKRDPLPVPATVTIESDPSGAEIELDASFVGSTPTTLQIVPGRHALSVKKGNHLWKRDFLAHPGSVVTIQADLSSLDGPGPVAFTEAAQKPSASPHIVCAEGVKMVPFSSSRPDRKTVNCGDQVTIVSEKAQWVRVRTTDGIEGNVLARFVEK